MKNLQLLQRHIDYEFKNIELLKQSLTHKSANSELNNERLEFLGDAVLDLIVGEYLFYEFKDIAEGDLSKHRAALVNEKSFANLAKSINLGKYIYISASEEKNNGRNKPSLLSDALEALIGAVYIDSGLEKAKEISINLLKKCYAKLDFTDLFNDHKTKLQELTQAKFGQTPTYKVLKTFGPDHKKEFEIAVMIGEKQMAKASGKSKKEAQQKAAQRTLKLIK